MRTLLIGLDAACRDVVEPLVDDDAVPTIGRLLEDGVGGRLESQIPPWTPSAWPSAYTGVNPGKHGVFGFLRYDGYDWSIVDAEDVRAPTIWEILDDRGLSSVVVNAPVTHPPPRIDGAVVPGYVAADRPRCHPDGLLEELDDVVDGEYHVYPEHEGSDDTSREEAAAEYDALVRSRGRAFRHLADRFDPEFGFLQFQVTDTVHHEFPGDDDLVERVYRGVDDQLERTLEACSPDVVALVSDHGMGEYDGYEFRANEFLRDRGYVETVAGGDDGMPSWGTVRDRRRGDGGPEYVRRLGTALARAGLTSQRIDAVLGRLGLRDVAVRLAPADVIRAATEQVDFPASRAYVRSRIELGVRINLAGREPDGTVPPEEYEATREELIEQLSAVTTPDGDPVFEHVAPRERYFEGPYVDRAPDVITVPAEFDHFLSARLLGDHFGPPTEPRNHKRGGMIAIAGEGVDASADLDGAHLFDVAPTVLAALGVPRGDRMDGSVLPPVEPCGTETYGDAADERQAKDRDTEAVEDRLAELGYIER